MTQDPKEIQKVRNFFKHILRTDSAEEQIQKFYEEMKQNPTLANSYKEFGIGSTWAVVAIATGAGYSFTMQEFEDYWKKRGWRGWKVDGSPKA